MAKDGKHSIARGCRSTGAAVLLALFALYYCGSTLFVHSHHTWHGLETHSHPYLPNSSHSHSDVQFSLISMLNTILTEPSQDVEVPERGECGETTLMIMPQARAVLACVATAQGRAPPFVA